MTFDKIEKYWIVIDFNGGSFYNIDKVAARALDFTELLHLDILRMESTKKSC